MRLQLYSVRKSDSSTDEIWKAMKNNNLCIAFGLLGLAFGINYNSSMVNVILISILITELENQHLLWSKYHVQTRPDRDRTIFMWWLRIKVWSINCNCLNFHRNIIYCFGLIFDKKITTTTTSKCSTLPLLWDNISLVRKTIWFTIDWFPSLKLNLSARFLGIFPSVFFSIKFSNRRKKEKKTRREENHSFIWTMWTNFLWILKLNIPSWRV